MAEEAEETRIPFSQRVTSLQLPMLEGRRKGGGFPLKKILKFQVIALGWTLIIDFMYTTCIQSPQWPEEGDGSPKAGITGSYEPPCAY